MSSFLPITYASCPVNSTKRAILFKVHCHYRTCPQAMTDHILCILAYKIASQIKLNYLILINSKPQVSPNYSTVNSSLIT